MWPTAFSYGGDMKWLFWQWPLLSQLNISPCNQAQLGAHPGAVPTELLSSVRLVRHQWPTAATTTPMKSSKVIPNLGHRPIRVEIALSNSIHLPTLREKVSTVTAQKQRRAAKSFSLPAYFMGLYCYMISSSHGPKMSFATLHKVLCGGRQVFVIYCDLRRSTLRAAWESGLCFIYHMTRFSSSSVKHFCHQWQGWIMFSEVGDELRETSFQRKLISTERLWLLDFKKLCFIAV